MIASKALATKAILAAALICPQLAAADGFTGADLLKCQETQQNSFFQSNVTMIGFVAVHTGKHEQLAHCIDGWYWKDGRADPEKNAAIRGAMERFPNYHPQMVILAVVEKACGKFKLS